MERTTSLKVDAYIKNRFVAYCKSNDVTLIEGLNTLLDFVVRNNIPLAEIDALMDKNLTKEVFRYHNYTAGFLKTFEKKQIALYSEILRNTQFLMLTNPDKKKVAEMIDLNEKNIKEALNDYKNRQSEKS